MSLERRHEAPIKQGAPARTALKIVLRMGPPDFHGRYYALLRDRFSDRFTDTVEEDVKEGDVIKYIDDTSRKYRQLFPLRINLPDGPLEWRVTIGQQQLQILDYPKAMGLQHPQDDDF